MRFRTFQIANNANLREKKWRGRVLAAIMGARGDAGGFAYAKAPAQHAIGSRGRSPSMCPRGRGRSIGFARNQVSASGYPGAKASGGLAKVCEPATQHTPHLTPMQVLPEPPRKEPRPEFVLTLSRT